MIATCAAVVTLLAHLVLGGHVKYEAPDDCSWHVTRADEVALTCRLRTLNSALDATNLSLIPADLTSSLSLECSSEFTARSNLPERGLAHLARLRQFSLRYCKLATWPAGALHGLTGLRRLSVSTYNEEWPLELAPASFRDVTQLEQLELSFNNLWSLPVSVLCPLTSLVSLNVSHNRLQELAELGFQLSGDDEPMPGAATTEAAARPACGLDVQVLDVSHNRLVTMPPRGLAALKRLRELRVNDNGMTSLADRALHGLKTLRILDASNNKLVALPPALFQDCLEIRELRLQNNSLGALAPRLLSGLKQLLSLDLSRNRVSSAWLDSDTFSGLIRLVTLDLSHNRLSALNRALFRDLYTLQILDLSHNWLEALPPDTFSPMSNLHTLLLSHNRLATLEPLALSGLFALSLLSLDNNQLGVLHEDALANCSALHDLNLSGNHLRRVPTALHAVRLLRTLDLGENSLEQLEQEEFSGLDSLHGLRLLGNQITRLGARTLAALPSLQILNLASNALSQVDPGALDANARLQAVRLDGNALTDVSRLFTRLPELVWLNVSDNQLTWFDFALVPPALQWLDLSRNQIEKVLDSRRSGAQLGVRTLDLSHNRLTRVTPVMVPATAELIFLNDNAIRGVDANTFVGKPNLTRVDLYANQISGMDLNSLRLTAVDSERPLPEFYIGGNPFECDCSMEWLQRINQLDQLRQHPRVMDLESVYCRLPYSRHRTFVPLLEADSSHFVCRYTAHCFALCHCCDFDACDCKMTCPLNCTCYHDQTWSAANLVDCSSARFVDVPATIPMDATEVYLDGNVFGDLSSHAFIGRKNLRVLFLNDSQVSAVHNLTFSGLKRLQVLHLENNLLRELLGGELASLEELRELYLHNNRLTHVHNATFEQLRSLELLRLDGNRLHDFPAWQLALNPVLTRLTLADNSWSCHCHFLRQFRAWLRTSIAKVTDAAAVTCVLRTRPAEHGGVVKRLGPHLADFNSTACSSLLVQAHGGAWLDSEVDGPRQDAAPVYLALAVLAALLLVAALVFAVAACRRKELRVWMYSRCGVKVCGHRTSSARPAALDSARLFDAYVSYSVKDEGFVRQVVCAGLEPRYRLCLHHRDVSTSGHVADAIVEAVEASRRTVLVVSPHFIATEWARFDVRSALREALQREARRGGRGKRLIVMLLGDIPPRELDPELRVILNKAAAKVTWGDRRFWDKLGRAMPERRGGVTGAGEGRGWQCCCRGESDDVVYEPECYHVTCGPPHSLLETNTLARQQHEQRALWH